MNEPRLNFLNDLNHCIPHPFNPATNCVPAPISHWLFLAAARRAAHRLRRAPSLRISVGRRRLGAESATPKAQCAQSPPADRHFLLRPPLFPCPATRLQPRRSEERRVGTEG